MSVGTPVALLGETRQFLHLGRPQDRTGSPRPHWLKNGRSGIIPKAGKTNKCAPAACQLKQIQQKNRCGGASRVVTKAYRATEPLGGVGKNPPLRSARALPLGERREYVTELDMLRTQLSIFFTWIDRSTDWETDDVRKYEDDEGIGIAESWIVDDLGIGGKRYIGSPKQPIFSVCRFSRWRVSNGTVESKRSNRTNKSTGNQLY